MAVSGRTRRRPGGGGGSVLGADVSSVSARPRAVPVRGSRPSAGGGGGGRGGRGAELRLPQGRAGAPHRRRPMGARAPLRQRTRGGGGSQWAAAAPVGRWAGEAAPRRSEQKAAAAAGAVGQRSAAERVQVSGGGRSSAPRDGLPRDSFWRAPGLSSARWWGARARPGRGCPPAPERSRRRWARPHR